MSCQRGLVMLTVLHPNCLRHHFLELQKSCCDQHRVTLCLMAQLPSCSIDLPHLLWMDPCQQSWLCLHHICQQIRLSASCLFQYSCLRSRLWKIFQVMAHVVCDQLPSWMMYLLLKGQAPLLVACQHLHHQNRLCPCASHKPDSVSAWRLDHWQTYFTDDQVLFLYKVCMLPVCSCTHLLPNPPPPPPPPPLLG